jgi:hypothetical protein
MHTPQISTSFVIRTEIQKVAFDNGFRIDLGMDAGWLRYRSTTAPGEIWVAAASEEGPWFLAVGLASVASELVNTQPDATSEPVPHGPNQETKAFSFATLNALNETLDRTYRLSLSLPDAPLNEFLEKTRSAPRTTEAERQVIQRVGQDIFRQALMKYWNGRCPLTGINDPALLRASHIVPWSECESDAQRLDVHNGLLLSALWDAAFDAGLVSFDDQGGTLYSPTLSPSAAVQLGKEPVCPVRLTLAHKVNLARHRYKFGFSHLASTNAIK